MALIAWKRTGVLREWSTKSSKARLTELDEQYLAPLRELVKFAVFGRNCNLPLVSHSGRFNWPSLSTWHEMKCSFVNTLNIKITCPLTPCKWLSSCRASSHNGETVQLKKTARLKTLLQYPNTPTRQILWLVVCAMLFALCFSAEAQQAGKVPRIGFVSARVGPT